MYQDYAPCIARCYHADNSVRCQTTAGLRAAMCKHQHEQLHGVQQRMSAETMGGWCTATVLEKAGRPASPNQAAIR